jgi:hypothetical protein
MRLKRYLTVEQSYLDEFKLDSKPNYAEWMNFPPRLNTIFYRVFI